MIIGNRSFECGTHVMAIINLTPDSFWQGSRQTAKSALAAVERAVTEGAAIIDIGAQSTRPGYSEVSADEEISRFLQTVKEIKRNFDVPVSVDTYFSRSARAALDAGADMINDVWGLTHDHDMAQIISEYGAAVCIMHNASQPLVGDIWQPIDSFLENSLNLAISAGIVAAIANPPGIPATAEVVVTFVVWLLMHAFAILSIMSLETTVVGRPNTA